MRITGQGDRPEDGSRFDAALRVVAGVTETVGQERIELVTFTRDRVCVQPRILTDGEQIARALGLDFPIDQRMFVPGHTLWTGVVQGLEIQVRGALRQLTGTTW
jgi:hypothetical protein